MEESLRRINPKELCHDRLGIDFEKALSSYDTTRRVETLVDDFFSDIDLAGKKVLDVGCGLGFFSEALKKRGADVTACDLGQNLVKLTEMRVGCKAVIADVLQLEKTFQPNSFDAVVSSECIEHTPDPTRALSQMIQVLKPGGYLSVSTPNLLWYPVVRGATLLKLRPFDGYENFSTWGGLRAQCQSAGVQILKEKGLHLIPFQFRLFSFSRWIDTNIQGLRSLMINICLFGRKN